MVWEFARSLLISLHIAERQVGPRPRDLAEPIPEVFVT